MSKAGRLSGMEESLRAGSVGFKPDLPPVAPARAPLAVLPVQAPAPQPVAPQADPPPPEVPAAAPAAAEAPPAPPAPAPAPAAAPPEQPAATAPPEPVRAGEGAPVRKAAARSATAPKSARLRKDYTALQVHVPGEAKFQLSLLQYQKQMGTFEDQQREALDDYFEKHGLKRACGTERSAKK